MANQRRTRITKTKSVYVLVASSSKRIAKVLSLLLIVLLLSCAGSSAQTTIVKPADKVLKDTTIRDTTYKLYIGSRGGKYIIMTSKTTGKTYKKYFKAKTA
jgi:hypothetical protein